jgi:hypothetical protein
MSCKGEVLCHVCKERVSRRKSLAVRAGSSGDGYVVAWTRPKFTKRPPTRAEIKNKRKGYSTKTPKRRGITRKGPDPRMCRDRDACNARKESK